MCICSSRPLGTDLTELQQRGLSIADFPVYEPISIICFVAKPKNNALAETERLTAAVTAKERLSLANRMLTAEFEVSQGLVEAKTISQTDGTFWMR